MRRETSLRPHNICSEFLKTKKPAVHGCKALVVTVLPVNNFGFTIP